MSKGRGKASHRAKKPRVDAGAAVKTALGAVAPWSHVPYEEQRERKFGALHLALKGLLAESGITLAPVVASPVTSEYRNKIDFTTAYDRDHVPCVGFRLAVDIAARCTKLIQASGFEPYDQATHEGLWRAITMRWSKANGELMLFVRATPKFGEPGRAAMTKLIDGMCAEPFGAQTVTSVFVQWHDGVAAQPSVDLEFTHERGADHIREQVLGMQFIVSPGAFFQANTECTNVLFTLVRDKVRQALVAGESSTLLDVCCGTGVIGLLLAGQVSQVVGVDLCGPAIVDARRNAACNQVSNAFFVHAKAEDVFARLLGTEDRKQRPKLSALDEQEMCKALQAAKTSQAFVAVVDPPRAGLHKSVISALRENALVNTIVYVSCNPTGSFVADAAALCTLQTKGAPFVLLECTPVDMFPNTEHCELVALFKRASPATAAATPATHAPTV